MPAISLNVKQDHAHCVHLIMKIIMLIIMINPMMMIMPHLSMTIIMIISLDVKKDHAHCVHLMIMMMTMIIAHLIKQCEKKSSNPHLEAHWEKLKSSVPQVRELVIIGCTDHPSDRPVIIIMVGMVGILMIKYTGDIQRHFPYLENQKNVDDGG